MSTIVLTNVSLWLSGFGMIGFIPRLIIILLALFMMPAVALSKPLIRTALLIGNSIYPDVPLLSPAEDIAKMSKALEKSQFKITKETNLIIAMAQVEA